MHRLLLPLLAALTVLGCIVPAQSQAPADKLRAPGIGAGDDRQPVDMNKMPWRAIGKLQTNLASSCTGTLVGPRLVLTAGHCLFNARTQALFPLSSLHFLIGYDRASFLAHATVLRAEHQPELAAAMRAKAKAVEDDWLLLVLDQPLGEKYGMVKLADRTPGIGAKLQSAGYGQDRSQILTGDLDCQVVAVSGPRIAHDCEITHGNSGGPILVLQDGEWRLAGVSVAIGQRPDKSWLGYAFDVSVVRAKIDSLK
jgi:protease YdgD